MNSTLKSLLFWMVLIVVGVLIWNFSTNFQRAESPMSFSAFLQKVEKKEVQAVTITGTNFGASQGTSTVTFNGTAATPTSWSATSIVVPVPAGATTGNVVVTVSGLASNPVSFMVLLRAPTGLRIVP